MADDGPRYSWAEMPAVDDGRLDAPAFRSNIGPILAALTERLAGVAGHAIDIGCGSGQHTAAFARNFPALTWWPTDPDPRHRQSADAWTKHFRLSNVMPAAAIDAAADDWRLGADGRGPGGDIAVIWSANVVHITAWAVTVGMIGGAGRYLKPGGRLLIYGPFSRDGVHNADSNAAFDRSLKTQDPSWGVRDIADIEALGKATGLTLEEVIGMPANNRILVFCRDS